MLFFLFGHFFWKRTFLRLQHFFFPSGYPINSIFQWQYVFIRFMFLMKYFPSWLSECLWPPNFSGCLNGGVLWNHVTNKAPAEKYGQKSRQAADLVKETPKHNPLITWPKRGHVTIWKIYISTFVTFIANKLGKLLTLGRIFSMQMLKSSPTSC